MSKNEEQKESTQPEPPTTGGIETGHPPIAKAVTNQPVQEMVTVPKSTLDMLVSKVGMLEEVADEGRKNRWRIQHQAPLGKVVRIKKWEGKYVLATKLTKNEYYQNPINKAWIEQQQVEVIFEGGDKQILDYQPFFMNVQREEAEVLQATRDMEGHETLVVKVNDGTPEGKKLTIDSVYVN